MIKITIVRYSEVDHEKLTAFRDENRATSHDDPLTHSLNFFRLPEYVVLAHAANKLVGTIKLQTRTDIIIDNTHTTCGMLGGVLVHKDHRMQGIAQMMLKEAMQKLFKEKMAFALLCTDIAKLGKLYGQVGFVTLGKKYYFYNLENQLCDSPDGMIASVSDKKIFDLAIKPDTKINIGPSNA